MMDFYEEAQKEAERKIKKLAEEFNQELVNIFNECTKKEPIKINQKSKAKEGTVFINSKRNVCVVLKSDNRYDWVLSKTKQGFCCNHYGKWWIEDCLDRKVYEIIGQYPTWQEAVNSKEFKE